MIKGDYILIGIDIGGEMTPIALCRSCTLSIDVNVHEVTSSTSEQDKDFIPGRYKWALNSSHLIGNFNYKKLHDLKEARQELTLCFHQEKDEPSAFAITGKALISSFSMGANINSLATAEVNFQGSGELSTEDYSNTDYQLNWAEADNNDRFTFNHWN